jgi:hypothetical protein
LNAFILIGTEMGHFSVGWTWLLPIGTAGTFLIGYVLGPVLE